MRSEALEAPLRPGGRTRPRPRADRDARCDRACRRFEHRVEERSARAASRGGAGERDRAQRRACRARPRLQRRPGTRARPRVDATASASAGSGSHRPRRPVRIRANRRRSRGPSLDRARRRGGDRAPRRVTACAGLGRRRLDRPAAGDRSRSPRGAATWPGVSTTAGSRSLHRRARLAPGSTTAGLAGATGAAPLGSPAAPGRTSRAEVGSGGLGRLGGAGAGSGSSAGAATSPVTAGTKREEPQRIEVALRIGSHPHAEVHVRHRRARARRSTPSMPDRSRPRRRRAPRATPSAPRCRSVDRVAVRGLDRDRSPASGHRAGEAHGSRRPARGRECR